MSNLRSDLMTQLMLEAHSERGIKGSERTLTSPRSRSNAGPGKWARKAVRGGYPHTALKHLKKLWKENGLSWYTLRIFAEVGLRLPGAANSHRKIPNTVRVPECDKWKDLALAFG